MKRIFSAIFFQLATSTVDFDYDFLDFWRVADVFAYQCRHSIKDYAARAERLIENYEIVREAAGYYDSWPDVDKDTLGECLCILPTYWQSFDEKASPQTNINNLKHWTECWIQESLININIISNNKQKYIYL